MTATSLAESFDDYAADAITAARYDAHEVQARRHYMAGAQAVLLAMRSGATREQLQAELIGFGRAIGSPAERASA